MNLEEIRNIIKSEPWVPLPETLPTLRVCHLWAMKPMLGKGEGNLENATEMPLKCFALSHGFSESWKYGYSLYVKKVFLSQKWQQGPNCTSVGKTVWQRSLGLLLLPCYLKTKKKESIHSFLASYFWQFVLSCLFA